MAWVYGGLALVLGCLFVLSVRREPARVRNAVLLGCTVLTAGLWLLLEASAHPLVGLIAGPLVLLVLLAGVLVLPVALLVNGVLMMRREGRRPANLLSLLAGAALVVVAALLIAAGPDGPGWFTVPAASVLLVTAYFGVVFTSLLTYSMIYGQTRRPQYAEAVVVLGSAVIGDRVPPLLASRLDRAVEIHDRVRDEGRTSLIVVSGGRGPGESVTEASAMRAYLVDKGLPPENILLEDRATTTEENLRYSRALLDEHGCSRSLVAVTNNFHVLRTAFLARRLGLHAEVVGSRTALYFLPSAFLREFVAILDRHRYVQLGVLCVIAAIPPLIYGVLGP